MKILIASDSHGRLLAVKKFDRLVQKYNPDKIVFLGDFLYNGPRNGVPSDYDPMACSVIFNKYASKIIAVRGNCDSRIDETLLHFKMEDSRVVFFNGFRCDLIHGDLITGELLSVSRGDILMYGHTHVYMLKHEDGVTYLNPGSISFPKNGSEPSYALMSDTIIQIKHLSTHQDIMSLEIGF